MVKKENKDQQDDLSKKAMNDKPIEKSMKKKNTPQKSTKKAKPKAHLNQLETEELKTQALDDIWDEKNDIHDWEEEFDPAKKIDQIIATYKEQNERDYLEAIKKLQESSPPVEAVAEEIPVVEAVAEEIPVVEAVAEEIPVVEAVAEEIPVVEAVAEETEEPVLPEMPAFVKEMNPEEYSRIYVEPPIQDENTPSISITDFSLAEMSSESQDVLNEFLKMNTESSEETSSQDDEISLQTQIQSLKNEKLKTRKEIAHHKIELNDESMQKAFAYLQQMNAYIEIRIDNPLLVLKTQPDIINPAPLLDDSKLKEFVYPIYDFNDRLITSKSLSHREENLGMYKMFQTIEKMITIMHKRISNLTGDGTNEQDEVRVHVSGHILCKRKAFEIIINLTENWLVMDFDPGQWGSNYLEGLQKLYKRGYQYPPPAPRNGYQYKSGSAPSLPKNKAPSS